MAITPQPGAARRTHVLLGGIPQHGSVLGSPKAPVTLQFFGDLQCKESRQVMLGALPFLIRRFVRDGELQIRYRSRETDTQKAGGWPEFVEQQAAALAAGEQGKLWDFIDVFYRDQGPEFTGYVDEAFLDQIARGAGLHREEWKASRTVPQGWVPQLRADAELASAKRLDSTPSFLIGPTGGEARPLLHFGLQEPKVFEEAVVALL
ncbi:MAG TPA: thioredoxin domain-containing protein [Solirubrobacterales bacterium]